MIRQTRPLKVGDILAVDFPTLKPSGREQQGKRPAVVVAIPERPRYPMLVVAPLTSAIGPWAENNLLYPILETGQGGLTARSVVMIDHLRCLDSSRPFGFVGSLKASEYATVEVGLDQLFGRKV